MNQRESPPKRKAAIVANDRIDECTAWRQSVGSFYTPQTPQDIPYNQACKKQQAATGANGGFKANSGYHYDSNYNGTG